MFGAYFDTSGNPKFRDPENYVLTASVINEADSDYVDVGIDKTKRRYFPDKKPADVEIHVKDMVNHEGVYEGVSEDRVYSMLDDVFGFISDPSTPITNISSMVIKKAVLQKFDIEYLSYLMVFERLGLYLAGKNKTAPKGESAGNMTIIIDNEMNRENGKLQNKIARILRDNPEVGRYVDDAGRLFFADSRSKNMIQVADCVGYCIRKEFRENVPNDSRRWLGYFSALEGKFFAVDGTYRQYGLAVFPRPEGGPRGPASPNAAEATTGCGIMAVYKTVYNLLFSAGDPLGPPHG
ncbi:MAG: DUF3800 domain-containing protein [Nitrosopumilus sp.]|nr:DUF3800 domain-containing protein [Nitrosopumilus sp.]